MGFDALDKVVTLRKAHDDVATMGGKRHPNEAARLRKIHIVELLLPLLREKFGELVLKTLALLVRERQIARVRAYAQCFGIDELDRQIGGIIGLRPGNIRADKRGGESEKRNQQPAMWYRMCRQRLLHGRPAYLCQLLTDVGNRSEPKFTCNPDTIKMLCSSIRPCNRNIPTVNSPCVLQRKPVSMMERKAVGI